MKIKNLLIVAIVFFGFVLGITVVNADSTVLYDDGTLIINEASSDREANIRKHGGTASIYDSFGENDYVFEERSDVLWWREASDVKSVIIAQTIRPTSTAYWFYGFKNLLSADFTKLDTSNVTDMSYMFYDVVRPESGHLDMDYMFKGYKDFDTSKVKNMSRMFYNSWLGSFSQYFDVSSVTDMSYMFGKIDYSYLDLSDWNTSNVTTMKGMFIDGNIDNELDISNWDTSKVTDMSYVFNTENTIILKDKLRIPDNCNVNNFLNLSGNFIGKFMFDGNVSNYETMFTGSASSNKTRNIGLYSTNDKSSEAIDSIVKSEIEGVYKNPYVVKISNKGDLFFSESGIAMQLNEMVVPAGKKVTLYYSCSEANILKTASVKDKNDNDISFDYSDNSFVMPNSDVDISATFVNPSNYYFGLNVDINDHSSANFSVVWEDKSANDLDWVYDIYKLEDNNYKFVKSVEGNDFKVDGLVPSESYKFKVVAFALINGKKYECKYDTINFTTPIVLTGDLNLKYEFTDYTKVNLSWDEIENATGYKVYYKKTSQDSFKLLYSGSETSTTASLSENSEYIFEVKPYVSFSLGNYIEDLNAKATIKTLPMPSVSVKSVDDKNYKNVSFSWTTIGDVDGYKIVCYEKTDYGYGQSSTYIYYTGTTTDNSYVITKNLKPFIACYVEITPYKISDSGEKWYGKSDKFRIITEPDIPEDFKLSSTLTDFSTIKVSWDKIEGATGYNVYYKEKSEEKYTKEKVTTNEFEKTFDQNKEYVFKVEPYGMYSIDFGFETSQKTSKVPSIFNILNESGSADLAFSWRTFDKVDGYKIYYKKVNDSDYTFAGDATDKYYVIKGLLPLRKYTIKIVPFVNFNGEQKLGKASTSNFTVAMNDLENLTTKVYQGNAIKITWDKIKEATGYKIYYKKASSKNYTYLGKTKDAYYYKSGLDFNTEYMFKLVPYILLDGEEVIGGEITFGETTGKIDISKFAKVTGVYNKSYTGKYRTLDIKVTYKGKRVPVKVTYKNNKNIGIAYVTIRGIGDYTGTITKKFYIVPSKASISSLKSTSKKKATLKYSYIKGNVRYQVAYKRSGTNTWKYVYYSNSYAKTIKNLKSKKKYTFKVRAYKKVNGKYIYGAWSNIRSVTVK